MSHSLKKKPPFRSKDLMKWVHANMKPWPCCVCEGAPWTRLHHFGPDGGEGMKPSDHLLARLCQPCAVRHEVKERALVRDGRLELLLKFYRDAAAIARAYIEHLERKGGADVEGTAGATW
jgi:hypothetical protein